MNFVKFGFVDGISNAIQLSNGQYVFSTFGNGITIVDQNGNNIMTLDDSNGLGSSTVHNLFRSKTGIIWVCHASGISKIEYPSPFTWFEESLGVNEITTSIEQFNDKTFITTGAGLKILDTKSMGNRFEIYKGQSNSAYDVTPFKDRVLVADRDNIKEIYENRISEIPIKYPTSFHISKLDPNRVFVTTAENLSSMYFDKGNWKIEGRIACETGTSYEMLEMEEGSLWLETDKAWVINVKFESIDDAFALQNPICKKYDQTNGLPNETGEIFSFRNELYFTGFGSGTTYRFNPIADRFELAVDLSESLFRKGDSIRVNGVDSFENLWFSTRDSDNREHRFVKWNNQKDIVRLHQDRIFDRLGGTYRITYDRAAHSLWLTGSHSIIRHNLSENPLDDKNLNTVINKVRYKSDSLLTNGIYHTSGATLPFKGNRFRFQYASPSFYEEEKNRFQLLLEGFDEDWSLWTSETQKDYTNIPEGDYTFKVRAKNIFGEISKEDSYSFTILPPWYRSWWAYALYGLGSILTLMLFSQWRSNQLRAKNVALEKVVGQRTQEIQEKNLLLEGQTEKLKELDTMKTRLFANISHEFRTPLTLIKGPVEKMEQAGETNLSMTNVKMIRRNANRLLKLVNQLLDLSKLDSGKLQLNAAEGDVFKCLRAAASSFSSHAAQRDIDYQISVASQTLWANFDRDKLEKITYNLLSNAFKFTQDKGKIKFTVSYRGERLQLEVSDSGQGIEKDKLPHIFDRFFQVDDSYTREKAGSGIGLALTKELVDLMEGEIYVESEFGKGSVFKVVMNMEEIKSHKKQATEEYKIAQQDGIETATPLVKTVVKEHHILIIEDNNDMRHFIKEQLQNEYEVLEAYNGLEGLKKAKKIVPDLIVTDLMMPQMDGITLCKELKGGIHTSHIPVVMLTAKAGIENKLEGLETGADDYLTKPFNARELQVRVRNLITERQKLRERYRQKPDINPSEITVTSLDEKFLNQVLELLEEKHIESEFGVPQMQDALGMSKTQLHRKLKALTNHPPGELLRNFRLKRAAQLLLHKGENVSQIAYAVGFNGLSYFTKCFKELYGVAPSDYPAQVDRNS
ncbi:ATP-binding protein [Maribacter sp.]|nr:ATP-binding protein [Maribacter sp.]